MKYDFPPAFYALCRRGILNMVKKHSWMLLWSPAHITEFYVALWLIDFKPSVN